MTTNNRLRPLISSGAVCIVSYLTAFAGGCGLLGIFIPPVPTTATVQFYAVPFVCELGENNQFAQSTAVLLHNPEAGEVVVYRRAVQLGLEGDPLPDPVTWYELALASDQAVKLDCDSIARILASDQSTTFADEFAQGMRVEGFLTVGIEAFNEVPRLDASVQYESADGSFDLEFIVPGLVLVDAWPPGIAENSGN